MISNITIISLTYKNWRILNTTIDSVFSQKFDHEKLHIEYLIVDDGTDDFDKKHIESLIPMCYKNISVKIIQNKKNVGTVKSFNNAIKISKGDIIVPLSSGDAFYNNRTLEEIIETFVTYPQYNIVTGKRVIISENIENILPRKLGVFWLKRSSSSALINYLLLGGNIISGASTYYRRNIFSKFGLFDENYKLLEDFPFYINALLNKEKIFFLEKKVIKYDTTGVSTSNNPILTNDFLNLYKKIHKNKKIFFFTRRCIYYTKILNIKSDKKINSYLTYIDVILFIKVKNILSSVYKMIINR
ncbi:glycosyltransferase [Xenorhabdus bharatensis]|uniref:glycosyltransferase n=1 Tax=Xenorhabdus bharatensis TaxID=3136256 RepID=UPI0030F479EE